MHTCILVSQPVQIFRKGKKAVRTKKKTRRAEKERASEQGGNYYNNPFFGGLLLSLSMAFVLYSRSHGTRGTKKKKA